MGTQSYFGLLFLLCPSLAFAQSTPSLHHVTSYDRNFIVISSDHALASWTAAQAERDRSWLVRVYGLQRRWQNPLVLRIEAPPSPHVLSKEKICGLIIKKIFPSPPYWLQCGLERIVLERREMHPDRLKEIQLAGKWIDLNALLRQQTPMIQADWQEIFSVESAGLVTFLKKKRPEILRSYRIGKAHRVNILALQSAWQDWIGSAHALMEPQNSHAMDSHGVARALARCLSVKVRDAQGHIYAAPSVAQLTALDPCCRKDIARRRLLAEVGRLIVISRSDGAAESLATPYIECANSALVGKEFYERFEALERQRLGLLAERAR